MCIRNINIRRPENPRKMCNARFQASCVSEANKSADSIWNRVRTNFMVSSVRKYRSLTKCSLPKSQYQTDICSLRRGCLSVWNLNLEEGAIRQRHSHTGIICLRAFTATVKRQTHLCASCRCSRVPDTSSAGSRPRFAPTVSGDPVTAFRISANAVHSLRFVSRGVCNLCAADNPRAGDKSFIAAESRHGARLLLPFALSTCAKLYSFTRRVFQRERKFPSRENALE